MPSSAGAHAPMTHDVFISHASEDKAAVARPLARALEAAGLSVWLDEAEITIGDSLRGSLDKGLAECRFGVVILSRDFFRKNWPQKELNGLAARENDGAKVILPVWHGLAHEDVLAFSPMLADRVAVSTDQGVDAVAAAVTAAVSRARPGDDTSAGRVASQVAPLDALRARLLQARDLDALRRLGYEVEALVRADPAHHEARWMQDQLREAIEREAIRTQPHPHAPTHGQLPAPRRRAGTMILATLAVALAILAIAAYWAAMRHGGPRASAAPVSPPAAVASMAAPAAGASAPLRMNGFLQFESDPGDDVGQGRQALLSSSDNRFLVTASRRAITVDVRGKQAWTLAFDVPEGHPLAAGDYVSAPSPARPSLDIAQADRHCKAPSGRFSILHIAFDDHDVLSRLRLQFEQHCDGKSAALRGALDLVGGVF
jgi:hypothetical protein